MGENMNTLLSTPCNEVVTALGKAQADMPIIGFDAQNPHFRNRYATLAHILATVRPVLASHSLALTQLGTANGGLVTIIAHTSGQWIAGELPIIAEKVGPQPFGSAMSYARRYGVCAILGVAAEEDDDGESATQRQPFVVKTPVPEKPLAPQKTIGDEKVKQIWKLAAVRVKELVERGDLPPDTKPDLIMRSLLGAWNLEHTAQIPAKLYDAFVNRVNRWLTDQPRDEMQPTAADAAF